MSLVTKNQTTSVQWAGGETFSYFIYPRESSYEKKDFLFRISVATIRSVPSIFSQFLHYHRYLVMLNNDLKVEQNAKEKHFKRQEVFYFNSSDYIESFSLGMDFNLMLHQSIKEHLLRVDHSIEIKNNGFVMVFSLEPTTVVTNLNSYRLREQELLLFDLSKEELRSLFCDKKAIIAHWKLP
ncbi:HutD family protein [Myroides sp. LJL115]